MRDGCQTSILVSRADLISTKTWSPNGPTGAPTSPWDGFRQDSRCENNLAHDGQNMPKDRLLRLGCLHPKLATSHFLEYRRHERWLRIFRTLQSGRCGRRIGRQSILYPLDPIGPPLLPYGCY